MSLIETMYGRVAKPIFFRMDPEKVHDGVTMLGRALGSNPATRALTRALLTYEHPMLRTTVAGIRFPNPVGLAAGFDKNARLTGILPDVGFGFAELGSFTGMPCAGNPRPRLWRHPDLNALRVYYGLKNDGADAIASRLTGRRFRIPIGISAAKTNAAATAEPAAAIEDYAHVIGRFRGIGDYCTVNISCPNAFGGEPFTDPALLEPLLARVDAIADKPVFVKLAAGLTPAHLDVLIGVCDRHRIAGFVCSNLEKKQGQKGGLSGGAVQRSSDEQIRYVAGATRGRYAIMGVGGIFTAEDAYRKIRYGASLVQLITGMIYRGPQLIGQINRGLARLLRRDGFRRLQDVIGVDNRA